MLFQGLAGIGLGFVQLVSLLLYYIKVVAGNSTPRSIFNTKFGPRTVAWGTLFPSTTLIMVIGILHAGNTREGTDHFSSDRVLRHLTHHQWTRLCNVLSALHALEISIPVVHARACKSGHGRPLLSEGHPTCGR
jgi:hypothetical protein